MICCKILSGESPKKLEEYVNMWLMRCSYQIHSHSLMFDAMASDYDRYSMSLLYDDGK